ncbi:MAG: NfeD family protein [Planctomycetota bacterium]|nr:NfeD family protein [Planctomycetota bacterium]
MLEMILLIIVLVLAALLLIAAEICTPMFGLLATAAIGCAAWAAYLIWTTFGGLVGIIAVVAMVVGLPIYAVWAVRKIPQTALGQLLTLKRGQAAPGEGTPEANKLLAMVGTKTTAETTLRPSGTIRIDGRRVVAQAETGMIEKGDQVEVIRATGMGVVVRKVQPPNEKN